MFIIINGQGAQLDISSGHPIRKAVNGLPAMKCTFMSSSTLDMLLCKVSY